MAALRRPFPVVTWPRRRPTGEPIRPCTRHFCARKSLSEATRLLFDAAQSAMLLRGGRLMSISIPSVVISYRGEDANSHQIDLGLLGQSIQGAAKLLGASANVVATGQYAKKSPTFAVRVLASALRAGSFEITVDFAPVAAVVLPLLPTFGDVMMDASKRAVEAISNYVIAKVARKEDAADRAMAVAEKALAELGHTSRTAIEAVERVAISNGPAVRQLVGPVGLSCSTSDAPLSDPSSHRK